MFGWFSPPADCASCSKRRMRSASCVREAGSTLIATVRLSFSSRARYTSPMPPAPRGGRTLGADRALEFFVAREIHLAHASRAEEREDLVVTETGAGGERHFRPS